MKVVVTGGGTGGHIYPALAVADALMSLSPGADITFIGGNRGMEADIVPATGMAFHAVTTRKLRKTLSPSTVPVLFALFKGYREASKFLKTNRPDVVIGMGGYVAAATVMAATRLRIPTVIQEQNAIPGRTNRWLARYATTICVSFEETLPQFPSRKTVLTGVPIRKSITSPLCPSEARKALGIIDNRPLLLVVGGSQGAQALNDMVFDAVPKFQGKWQVLHQTGASNFEAQSKRSRLETHSIRPYFDAITFPLAYRSANLILCRCGASTLAEIAANGLPAIMVPLPTAYADHQTANARAVERKGAGILLPQLELTGDKLADTIVTLGENRDKLRKMALASCDLGRPEAATHVAEESIKASING